MNFKEYSENQEKGIFELLQNYNIPWKNSNISTQLDNYFKLVEARDLIIAPLLYELSLNEIVSLIFATHSENWDKLYENYIIKYNPIENYSMTEISKDINIKTNEIKNTGTIEDSSAGSNLTTFENTSTNTSSIFAFNSNESNAITTGITANPSTTNDSINENKTRTNNLAETSTEDFENNHNLTRSGNIGVTTSAQMIVQNLDLWKDFNFFKIVFEDIKKTIGIGVYSI